MTGRIPRSGWRRWYRRHLLLTGDYCRRCGCWGRHVTANPSRGLRLGHILAASRGGSDDPPNRTITCGPCELAIGDRDMRGVLPSLIADREVWARCVDEVSTQAGGKRARWRWRTVFDRWTEQWRLDTSRPAAERAAAQVRATAARERHRPHVLTEMEHHDHGGVL